MEILLIIIGALLIITGFIGAFLPILPGPPLSYVGLLLLQLTDPTPFSLLFMIIWAVIVMIIMLLDNLIPAWGAKKYGGSPWGVWGCIIGVIAGIFFFPPFGMIIGPLVGAFLGELAGGKERDQAFTAAWGSFIGLLLGTLLNVIACGVMGYYFFVNI